MNFGFDFDTLSPNDVTGVVAGFSGTSPGPAAGITYDIDLNLSTGIRRVSGVSPINPRWPDPIHTVAAPAGTVVKGVRFGQTIVFVIPEMPKTIEANCP